MVGACTGSSALSTSTTLDLAPICRQLAVDIVDQTQTFVDEFSDATLSDFPGDELPGLDTLQADIDAARSEALARGCREHGFEEILAFEARSISGRGPVGRPLAASLRGEDPASDPPETVELTPDDDLPATIARLGSGSVVNLSAGTYQLDEALLVDREVSINGAGVTRTTLRSNAREGAILVVQPGSLALTHMAVEHTGEVAANAIVAAGSGLMLDGVRLSGADADPEGEAGGNGLLLVGTEGSARSVVTNSEFADNERIGIALFGPASAQIGDVAALDNGVCGICLFDEARVTLEDSTLSGNEVGVGASGTADLRASGVEITDSTVAAAVIESAATVRLDGGSFTGNESGIQASGSTLSFIRGNQIEGGEVALLFLGEARAGVIGNTIRGAVVGLQVGDLSAPVVRSNTILSSSAAAAVFTGSVGGLLAKNTLSDTGDVTVQVAGSARPRISENVIAGPGPIGVNYTDDSGGSLVDNTVSGLEGGVQLSGNAAPEVAGNLFEELVDYSIAVFEGASGTISGNHCAAGVPGIVLVGGAAPELSDNDCTVVRSD